jgi:hypothetical protein
MASEWQRLLAFFSGPQDFVFPAVTALAVVIVTVIAVRGLRKHWSRRQPVSNVLSIGRA